MTSLLPKTVRAEESDSYHVGMLGVHPIGEELYPLTMHCSKTNNERHLEAIFALLEKKLLKEYTKQIDVQMKKPM
jgi:hypothetical protein